MNLIQRQFSQKIINFLIYKKSKANYENLKVKVEVRKLKKKKGKIYSTKYIHKILPKC